MTNASDILLAADIAVRCTLESVAKMVVNHRGRSERGRYAGIDPADLYLSLDPRPTSGEMDRVMDRLTKWHHLPTVLDDGGYPNINLYMAACTEYVRAVMLSQTAHHPSNLLTYLEQADAVAAAG